MVQEDEIIVYQPDSSFSLEVRIGDETVWLTRQQMAGLFQRDRTVIGRHINNIFKEGELEESLVCAKFAHTKDYGRRSGFTQNIETDYLYHIGASLKDLGKKLFAFVKMETSPDFLLDNLKTENL